MLLLKILLLCSIPIVTLAVGVWLLVWLFRRLGAKGGTLVIIVIVVTILYLDNLSDRHSFAAYSKIALPEEAWNFHWHRKGGVFGNDEGTILFRASGESLRRIIGSPFKGTSTWTPAPDGHTWTMCYQDARERAWGLIDLKEGTFRIEYR